MKVGESRIGESAVGVENWHPPKQETTVPKPEKINQAVSIDELLHTAKFGKEITGSGDIDPLLKMVNKEGIQNLLLEAYKKYDELYDKRNESPEASDALDQMEAFIDILRKKKEQPETSQETQAETQAEKVVEKPAEKPEVVLSPEEQEELRNGLNNVLKLSREKISLIMDTDPVPGKMTAVAQDALKIKDQLATLFKKMGPKHKDRFQILSIAESLKGALAVQLLPVERGGKESQESSILDASKEIKSFIATIPLTREHIPSPLDVTPPQPLDAETKTGTAS